MKITISYGDKKKEDVYENVDQFALVGVMSGTVAYPIFTKSIIQDKDILSALCEALKEKVKNVVPAK